MATHNAPTRIIAAPANLPLTPPNWTVFSSRTKMAIAAIHSRFITPPTKSNPMRIQQQAHAVGAEPQSHAEGAEIAGAPVARHEVRWGPAGPKAGILQRGQLVDASRDQ